MTDKYCTQCSGIITTKLEIIYETAPDIQNYFCCIPCRDTYINILSNKKKEIKSLEKQEGGTHYKDMAIKPAEYIHKNGIGFLAGNAIKYLSRYEKKNGAEDIKKAIHYCEMILEMEYGVEQECKTKDEKEINKRYTMD